ncbi:hypothetical protein PAMP_003738 [Pampus punctatissimus]
MSLSAPLTGSLPGVKAASTIAINPKFDTKQQKKKEKRDVFMQVRLWQKECVLVKKFSNQDIPHIDGASLTPAYECE